MTRRHIFIPDLQVRPGVPTDQVEWIGRYIAEKKPDVVVQIGDLYDMHSLSSYDKGKKSYEGRRYKADIEAGNDAFARLHAPIQERIDTTRRSRRKMWKPELHFLAGNHEERILRAVNNDAMLDGTIGYHNFDIPEGWQFHDFLEVVWIDGIAYSHYFAQPLSGRPYGGQSIDTRLKSLGHSFSMGHQQVMMFGRRETAAGAHYGLVAGNAYLHDEAYRGPQANKEWRGIVVKNEVENGSYDATFVSLNFLCRRYEGVALDTFLLNKYGPEWMTDRTRKVS